MKNDINELHVSELFCFNNSKCLQTYNTIHNYILQSKLIIKQNTIKKYLARLLQTETKAISSGQLMYDIRLIE